MKILCVAEKNDAAKNIASQLSRGSFSRREGFSKFNKIYEFTAPYQGGQAQFIMTSASGHLMNYAFPPNYKNWEGLAPVSLFGAQLQKNVTKDALNIKKTLEREIRRVALLIIWTDCDREGENIGAEVRDICLKVKPTVPVKRAKFSEITQQAIQRAMVTLAHIDEKVVDAVDARQELDLRIGAAFTRLQTLFLRRKFPHKLAHGIISYGSCQFPTLGFIVERYRAIDQFQAEPFWKIELRHQKNNQNVVFHWDRNRIFRKEIACAFHKMVLAEKTAEVVAVNHNPKSKWRPLPLETVELEKKARMLGFTAKTMMTIAEKLYTSGYISYPRTETNIFPPSLPLEPLVQNLTGDNRFGSFATEVLNNGICPRNGKKSDQAHPPIHPLKNGSNLSGPEAKVYEFVARRFLACISRDAKGAETVCRVKIAHEIFEANGLVIHDRGYLDVYPYERWGDKNLPNYDVGEKFQPNIDLNEGSTSAPNLLSETDLIGLMDKYGIGTDATHADHIETIQKREYVTMNRDRRFSPSPLGIALVNAYDELNIPLAGHRLRSSLERDLVKITAGTETKQGVLAVQLEAYKEAYVKTEENLEQFYSKISEYFGSGNDEVVTLPQTNPVDSITRCPGCSKPMSVNTLPSGIHFIGCTGYPECRTTGYLPKGSFLQGRGEPCRRCGEGHYKASFYFPQGSVPPFMQGDYDGCLFCDQDLKSIIVIRTSITPQSQSRDQGRPSQNNFQRNGSSTVNSGTTRGGNRGANRGSNRGGSRGGNQGGSRGGNRGGSRGGNQAGGANKRKSTENNCSGIPKCRCGTVAVGPLTVAKDGPNKGRQFFSCGKNKECTFFQWADEPSHANKKTNRTANHTGSQPAGEVMCKCSASAPIKVVRKDGPNCGRPFYGCANNMACNFFQWADEARSVQSTQSSASNSRGDSTQSRQRKPPTCGNCGKSGHTKRSCSNK